MFRDFVALLALKARKWFNVFAAVAISRWEDPVVGFSALGVFADI